MLGAWMNFLQERQVACVLGAITQACPLRTQCVITSLEIGTAGAYGDMSLLLSSHGEVLAVAGHI